jgi:hypothetical protein
MLPALSALFIESGRDPARGGASPLLKTLPLSKYYYHKFSEMLHLERGTKGVRCNDPLIKKNH